MKSNQIFNRFYLNKMVDSFYSNEMVDSFYMNKIVDSFDYSRLGFFDRNSRFDSQNYSVVPVALYPYYTRLLGRWKTRKRARTFTDQVRTMRNKRTRRRRPGCGHTVCDGWSCVHAAAIAHLRRVCSPRGHLRASAHDRRRGRPTTLFDDRPASQAAGKQQVLQRRPSRRIPSVRSRVLRARSCVYYFVFPFPTITTIATTTLPSSRQWKYGG